MSVCVSRPRVRFVSPCFVGSLTFTHTYNVVVVPVFTFTHALEAVVCSRPMAELTTWDVVLHSCHPTTVPYRGAGIISPLVVITADTTEFRRLARGQIQAHDKVVEIGCSYGQASRLLLAGASYLGLDNSYECITHCQNLMPNARFVRMDVMSDQDGLRSALIAEMPTLVVLDIGGVRSLSDVMCIVELVISELACRSSSQMEDTSIGVGTALLILLKSEKLVADLEMHHFGVAPTHGNWLPVARITCPAGWWAAARQRCQLLDNGGKALGLDAKLRVPTWYPQRAIKKPGAPFICRYHNYALAGCKKSCRCPFDHDHCHFCLAPGHIARECEAFNATLKVQRSTITGVTHEGAISRLSVTSTQSESR